MIEWILAQQALLSLSLALLIGIEAFFSRKLGPAIMYRLWLLVPIVLIINCLPTTLMVLPESTISYYVIGVTPALHDYNSNWPMVIWSTGAATISAYVFFSHHRIASTLKPLAHQQEHIYTSHAVNSPILFGIIKPRIIVPTNFTLQFSRQEQALILKHESTHYGHFDHIWNLVALCLLILFWFNPMVWLAMRAFRTSQEVACDAAVLCNSPEKEKFLYAKALVQCAEHSTTQVNLYPSLGDKRTMLKRLHAIKNPTSVNKIVFITSMVVAGVICTNTALAKLTTPTQVSKQDINKAPPVKTVNPMYPTKAEANGQEGFVVLQFDITENGATDNIKVIKSAPSGLFDKSAINAFRQWQYKPRIQNGNAQRQSGLLVQLDYRLDPPADSVTAK